jgi:hypothetical protein
MTNLLEQAISCDAGEAGLLVRAPGLDHKSEIIAESGQAAHWQRDEGLQ